MSDSPTKSFKDFIGWAFAGLVTVVLALVVMIYSSLHADVEKLDAATQQHALQIQRTSDRGDDIQRQLHEIKDSLKTLHDKVDLIRK